MKHSIFSALLIAGALFMSFNSAAAKNSTGNDQGKTKTVEVNGAKISYRIYGNKAGTPLVLLSPLGSSLDDWDPAGGRKDNLCFGKFWN